MHSSDGKYELLKSLGDSPWDFCEDLCNTAVDKFYITKDDIKYKDHYGTILHSVSQQCNDPSDFVKWLIKKFKLTKDDISDEIFEIVRDSCSQSNFNTVKIIIEEFNLQIEVIKYDNYISLYCLVKNNLSLHRKDTFKLLKYLVDKYKLNEDKESKNIGYIILKQACESGNVEMAEWIKNTFDLSKKDFKAYDSCRNLLRTMNISPIFDYDDMISWLYFFK